MAHTNCESKLDKPTSTICGNCENTVTKQQNEITLPDCDIFCLFNILLFMKFAEPEMQ